MVNNCPECLKKQRQIDDLKEEIKRLKATLRRQEHKEKEGFFGSSTSSSKKPVKANTDAKEKKPRGAKTGHKGSGRRTFDETTADQTVVLEPSCCTCPDCGGVLESKGIEPRMVLDSFPVMPQQVIYKLPKQYCPHCRRSFRPQPPGVLPKSLYGNQLIANAVAAHYLHGLPMGRISEQTGIEPGALVSVFQRVAQLFKDVPAHLVNEYREAPVKHADETSWRTDGQNGYAWLFATKDISIFRFGENRSAAVPREVFGTEPIPGVLIVDRYSAYNKVPCEIQYCYAHLLRDITDLKKTFPDDHEVAQFVDTAAPLIAQAIGLRAQDIPDVVFMIEAAKLKSEIEKVMNSPAKHLGIRHIQDIFQMRRDRLYHWADDRRVPAENNLAERDLRPSVIARKVSFGSGSNEGARVRSILTTLVSTIKKRGVNVASHLKSVLDRLSLNIDQDPIPLLFPIRPPT